MGKLQNIVAILETDHSEPICSVPGTRARTKAWARQSLILGCTQYIGRDVQQIITIVWESANVVGEGQRK